MSVVIRVTSDGAEKRSMFSKEKRWIRSKISRRRFRAKPAEALAPAKPAAAPQASDSSAISTSTSPSRTTDCISTPALMRLTSSAV